MSNRPGEESGPPAEASGPEGAGAEVPVGPALPVASPAEGPPVARAVPALQLPPGNSPEMEERLRRLEESLRHMEQMQRQAAPAGPESGIRADGGKGPSWWSKATAWFSSPPLLTPPQAAPAPDASLPRPPRAWFLLDTIADARAIVRMYADPRYRLTWRGRLLPPALLFAFLTVDHWLPFLLPCIGWLLLKIPPLNWIVTEGARLLLAFVLFRALGLEARRYRETAPDLPPSLRL